MRVNLALQNIGHSLPRTIVSLAGIGIAITLIFVQLGFRGAVENTALMIYEKMEFDLIVRSPDYLHFIDSGNISQTALDVARGISGVHSAVPFHVTLVNWRNPLNSDLRGMVLMGVDPAAHTFNSIDVNQDLDQLTSANQVLVDTESSAEFGPQNGVKFSDRDVGVQTELAGHQVRIAGLYRMGAGLTANGSSIISVDGYSGMVPWDAVRRPAMGLIHLEPGRDPNLIAAQIMKLTSDSNDQPTVEVLTRRQVLNREISRWISETPIGFVFTLGVGTAFIVGAAIFYMVLSNDVTTRLKEYATLRAMGYRNSWLAWVVLKQAVWLAMFAFVPSVIVSVAFYEITSVLAKIPIFMTPSRLVFVFMLTQLMCMVSGTLALRKLWSAEPASLF